LRARGEDVIHLAETFLARFSKEEERNFQRIGAETKARLLAYGWPGNVRQLENLIRRIVVLHDGEEVNASMLPTDFGHSRVTCEVDPSDEAVEAVLPYREQERRIIEAALLACGGNISRAAAALEISPATIYRKRQSWAGQST
jgi:two-component system, repressor protein LuxO